MKHTIIFILLFLFVIACTGRQTDLRCGGGGGALDSVTVDLRCEKIEDEAYKKGVEKGVCYNPLLKPESHEEPKHPDPKACQDLLLEADKKCADLPPAGPGDIDYLSGGAVYQGKKPVMIDGKPVCP